jgi:hypothetical protein
VKVLFTVTDVITAIVLFLSSASTSCSGRRVPGVVYGVDNDGNVSKQLVTVHELDIERELRRVGMSFENTIYELVVKRELTEDELKTAKPTETKTTPTEVAAPQEPGVHREGDEYRPKWGYKPKVKKVRVEEPAVELERILVTPRQIQFNPGELERSDCCSRAETIG